MAVGTADGHPAIWRRATDGSWTLESAASAEPVDRLGRADLGGARPGGLDRGRHRVRRQVDGTGGLRLGRRRAMAAGHLPAGRGGGGTEFLGVAAGRAGYVVVGRQMIGGRAFAALWCSADLRSWSRTATTGWTAGWRRPPRTRSPRPRRLRRGRLARRGQAIWISSDGRHWRLAHVPAAGRRGQRDAHVPSRPAEPAVVAGGLRRHPAGRHPGGRGLSRWRRPRGGRSCSGTGTASA